MKFNDVIVFLSPSYYYLPPVQCSPGDLNTINCSRDHIIYYIYYKIACLSVVNTGILGMTSHIILGTEFVLGGWVNSNSS